MSFDQWPHFVSLAIKKSLAHSVENWWEMTRSPLSTWTYHVTRPALRYRVIPAHTKHFCMTICCLLVCVMLLDHTKWHMTTCFKEDSYWMTFFYPLLSAVSAVSRWEIYSTTCFCTVGLFTVRAVIPMCFKSDNWFQDKWIYFIVMYFSLLVIGIRLETMRACSYILLNEALMRDALNVC